MEPRAILGMGEDAIDSERRERERVKERKREREKREKD